MRADRKAMNDFIMGGVNLGIVAAVLRLRDLGWDDSCITERMQEIHKSAGDEAVRSSGINCGPAVPSLLEHMRFVGRSMAEQMHAARNGGLS